MRGIVPACALLGISTLIPSPPCSDQSLFGVDWFVDSTQTLSSITQNQTRYNEAFAQWNRTHTGPFTAIGTTHVAFLRLDSEALGNFTDPSAGPHSPHIEIEFQVSKFP